MKIIENVDNDSESYLLKKLSCTWWWSNNRSTRYYTAQTI